MAGFRTFATGEVLTAANVNNFLMKQSVMVFADAAARTSALGAEVAEGMLTYNEDTEQLEVFDGTNFVLAAPEPPAGIGSNVVQAVKTDTFTTTSSTFVDVPDLAVTITPSNASSKILVFVSCGWSYDVGEDFRSGALRLIRGGTVIFAPASGGERQGFAGTGRTTNWPSTRMYNAAGGFVDAPATTSATTYKVQAVGRRVAETGSGQININRSTSAAADYLRTSSTLIAIEVAA